MESVSFEIPLQPSCKRRRATNNFVMREKDERERNSQFPVLDWPAVNLPGPPLYVPFLAFVEVVSRGGIA